MDTEKVLQQFGLTDIESRLYLIMLKTGETTAPNLVYKIKMHKTTVYDLLAILERKGLATHLVRDGKKYYSPIEPKSLLAMFEDRMGALRAICPVLETYYASTKPEMEIKVYEGRNGIRTMLNDMISVGKPVFVLGSSLQMYTLMEHRIAHTLKNARPIVPKTKIILSDKKQVAESVKKVKEFYPNLEVRYYPEKTSLPVGFNIYGDRITFMLWKKEAVIISIRDACIAKTFKTYFDMIWSISKN